MKFKVKKLLFMENASQRDSVMNQTFTVDRGQLDDHKYKFLFQTAVCIAKKTRF